MKEIKFDFNNMFADAVGSEHGVTKQELRDFSGVCNQAHSHLRSILDDSRNRVALNLEWANLPFQDPASIKKIQSLGDEIAAKYENVLSLGIGGSFLGLKAAQDALAPAYYNEFPGLRKGRPRIYFEGNNLDPQTLGVLLKSLNPRKTFVIVISKSGETTETKAAFQVVEPWLKKGCGKNYGRQVFAITDPASGTLRRKVDAGQAKDKKSFRNMPLLKGVGGRYSEFNMGLLHLAIIGVKISEALAGAGQMSQRCRQDDLMRNPAYLYAALHNLLYRKKGKPIGILMPFCESLRSTADWYCQLLAESTGKKYARIVKRHCCGQEEWDMDKTTAVNVGRTPIATRGTNDLHSVQQNNIEGQNDKVVTFIRVEEFTPDIKVPGAGDILSGKSYSRLMSLAQEATEWALVRNQRPNCTIVLPEVTARTWGGLLFFFEMATAFEGELLNINAFDQPGVESYKNYMYHKLKKPGLAQHIADEIEQNPLVKKPELVL